MLTARTRFVTPMRVPVIAAAVCFCALTVYAQYAFLETTDNASHRGFRELSLAQYHETLEGRRWFPFQWRVAAPWLVYAGERTTHLDPHLVDAAIKTAALSVSVLVLMRFAAQWTTPVGALLTGSLYVALTGEAFATEGYAIYYTNDYLMVMGWFVGVWFVARRQFPQAALVTFLSSWAKETIVLLPVLVGLEWLRGRARLRDVVVCTLAFAVPTAVLRIHYPAPLHDWAWWGNIARNVPLAQREPGALAATLAINAKLVLFFNVLWILSVRAVARAPGSFQRDLAYVGAMYLVLAYVVVYIRELRHFLPLAIVVLPPAVCELERLIGTATGSSPRDRIRHGTAT